MTEDPIQRVVAANGQNLLAHRFLAYVQPVKVFLAVGAAISADQPDTVEQTPMLLGKLRQAHSFDGVVVAAGVVRFEDIEAIALVVLADEGNMGLTISLAIAA